MPVPSFENLRCLYEDAGLSDAEIGDRFGVTGMTVCRWRKLAGIVTMPDMNRRRIRGGHRYLDLDEPTLRRLYVVDGLGMDEIGRRYGCSKIPIRELIHKFGIPVTAKRWEKKGLPDEIPADMMPVVIGTLLGDACIAYDNGGDTARYKVSHGYSQFSYISAIHRRFGSWAKRLLGSDTVDLFGRRRIGHSFYSVAHPAFRQLRQSWYRDDLRGEFPVSWLKCPPRSVLESLSDEALAYWYFDDGTHGFSIAAFFPLIPPEEIAHLVSVGTGLRWYPKGAKDGEMFNLSLRAADHDEFQARILPWATPDMAHKFDRSFWSLIPGIPETPPEIDSRDVERLAFYTIPSWQNLDLGAKAQWVREVFEIHRRHGFPYPRETPPNEAHKIFANLKSHSESLTDGHVFSRSKVGLSMCDGYAPQRYARARLTFEDDASFIRLIEAQFKSPAITHVTRTAMRVALGGAIPIFRPSTAKALVDTLCPVNGDVWIPVAGFGGALLGAAASDRVGRIVCHETTDVQRMWSSIGCGSSRVEFTLFDGPVDLILAAPIESDFGSLWSALRTGGHVVFHLDVAGASALDRLAVAAGFRRVFRLWYPVDGQREDEIILVYAKDGLGVEPDWDLTARRVVGSRHHRRS